MENLRKALSFGGILNAEEIARICDGFTPLQMRPGDHFYSPGEISNRLGFVESGVLRVYLSNENMDEATKYFIRTNQFMMDIESFYNNAPTDSGIQAVTECRALYTTRKIWQQLSEEIPKLFILTKTLTEAALLNKIKDNDFLYFGTARQKYDEFLKRYPDLALTVPLQYIASYLQITPQSLSRIRKG